jgi:hypothetical protein
MHLHVSRAHEHDAVVCPRRVVCAHPGLPDNAHLASCKYVCFVM